MRSCGVGLHLPSIVLCQFLLQYSILAFALFLFASCSENSNSKISFAHVGESQLPGTPAARFHAHEIGKLKGNGEFPVCFQAIPGSMTENTVKLEIQLALAAWVNAGFSNPAEVFSKFTIQFQNSCAENSPEVALVVREGKSTDGQQNNWKFQRPNIVCNQSEAGSACSISLRKAFGAVSGVSISVEGGTNRWMHLAPVRAAIAVFHPMIRWHSLSEDVVRNDGIADSLKKQIQDDYAKLLASNIRSFESLLRFDQLIGSSGIIESKDRGFSRAFETVEFQDDSRSLKIDYVPEVSFFHTLLHELGHVFGLSHADNPQDLSVTGESASTVKNGNGRDITSEAVMAYGLPYLYLTPDDVKGARAVSDAARKFITDKFR